MSACICDACRYETDLLQLPPQEELQDGYCEDCLDDGCDLE